MEHQLICDWQPGGTASTHTCAGCDWKVISVQKPGQAVAAAVQAAYNTHLNPEAGLTE